MRLMLALLLPTAVLLLLLSKLHSIPKPKPGHPIKSRHYNVNTEILSSSRTIWTSNNAKNKTRIPDSIHTTAQTLAGTFVLMSKDDSLQRFLDESANATSSAGRMLIQFSKEAAFHSLQRYLGLSRPDASGFVKKANLYVASVSQYKELLGYSLDRYDSSNDADSCSAKSLLDVGSGTGTDTVKLASAMNINPTQITCIETSKSMRKILRNRGFRVLSTFSDIGSETTSPFTTVSLLNVLDRCDNPRELLESAINVLKPGGHLIMSIVLPFNGRVYEGKLLHTWKKAWSRYPNFPLSFVSTDNVDVRTKKTFEFSVARFFEAISRLQPQLEIVRWTRLPYVSSGDSKKTHYTLDMAVAVLKLHA